MEEYKPPPSALPSITIKKKQTADLKKTNMKFQKQLKINWLIIGIYCVPGLVCWWESLHFLYF